MFSPCPCPGVKGSVGPFGGHWGLLSIEGALHENSCWETGDTQPEEFPLASIEISKKHNVTLEKPWGIPIYHHKLATPRYPLLPSPLHPEPGTKHGSRSRCKYPRSHDCKALGKKWFVFVFSEPPGKERLGRLLRTVLPDGQITASNATGSEAAGAGSSPNV